jgi:hypothetical protein
MAGGKTFILKKNKKGLLPPAGFEHATSRLENVYETGALTAELWRLI